VQPPTVIGRQTLLRLNSSIARQTLQLCHPLPVTLLPPASAADERDAGFAHGQGRAHPHPTTPGQRRQNRPRSTHHPGPALGAARPQGWSSPSSSSAGDAAWGRGSAGTGQPGANLRSSGSSGARQRCQGPAWSHPPLLSLPNAIFALWADCSAPFQFLFIAADKDLGRGQSRQPELDKPNNTNEQCRPPGTRGIIGLQGPRAGGGKSQVAAIR